MSIKRKIKHTIENPLLPLQYMVKSLSGLLPSELYIKLYCRCSLGYWMNLKEPKTFNEKLNWLKINDHNPLYTILADKYKVKDFVKKIIGEEYVLPIYGKWNNAEDIDFELLPDSFVLKTNHNSSGVIICKDKCATLNGFQEYKQKLTTWLRKKYYTHTREWVYKDIQPCIFAEQLLGDGNKILVDYKFWCFNGEPKFMYMTNKSTDIFENFYDMNFNVVDINHGFKRQSPEFEKPQNFELMKTLSQKLSTASAAPFVRVDFYDVDGRVYFGEFTFYDWAGFRRFKTYEMDYQLGSIIHL